MDKKISVIIPIYNAQSTIQRTLDSILNQTYNNIEVILVNDGSSDNSLKICNTYKEKDSRVIVIDKENGGPSSARNEGLKNATGFYVQFVDADDELDYTYTEKMISYFKAYKNLDLVISGITIISKNKRFVNFDKCGIITQNNLNELVNQQNFYGLIASPCNKIYLKEKLNIEFPKDIKNGEDAIFNLNYLQNCKNIYLTNNESYNYYYENPNSLTKKYSEKRFLDTLFVREQLKAFFNNIKIDGTEIINRLLLRDVCSLTKSLIKEKNISKREKIKLIKEMLDNNQVREAIKKYISFGFVEKLAFRLIKNRRVKLFYFCCKIK